MPSQRHLTTPSKHVIFLPKVLENIDGKLIVSTSIEPIQVRSYVQNFKPNIQHPKMGLSKQIHHVFPHVFNHFALDHRRRRFVQESKAKITSDTDQAVNALNGRIATPRRCEQWISNRQVIYGIQNGNEKMNISRDNVSTSSQS